MIDDEFDDLKIANILSSVKTIAMVGASNNWKRPSNFVMKYLQKKGYKIIPVNPREAGKKINNELCYASLKDIPINIDMVDVFRRSDECLELAKETIKIKAKVFWMQIGIFNSDANELILKNKLECIFNRCPKIEHSRIFGELGSGGFYSKLISSKKNKHYLFMLELLQIPLQVQEVFLSINQQLLLSMIVNMPLLYLTCKKMEISMDVYLILRLQL